MIDIECIKVISENVNMVEYHKYSQVLVVHFNNGAVYRYRDVPYSIFEVFKSPNPWRKVGIKLKNYSYTRIN